MAKFTGALASETTTTVILFVFVLCNNMWLSSSASAAAASVVSVVDPMTITILPPHAGSNRHTMFVPLFLSLPNSSRVSSFSGAEESRRHLQKYDTARMTLHDDLPTTGYYSARLWIGTPPQKFALIVDTGSSVTYIPCSTCQQCGKHQLIKELHTLKRIKGSDPNFKDFCFSGAGSDVSELHESFPSVEMVFRQGHKLSLSPENYLFRHSTVRGAYCLGVFQNVNDTSTVLGGIIVRNIFVMYDREQQRIGFWKTNCSDLLARLTATGVLPSTPDKSHSSSYPSPSAPLGPTYHVSSGSKVGSIVFYMSLNIKHSKLEPHITELTQLISMDLHVNGSQIYLLDTISEANGSLTIWVITPPKPAEYMSKAAASNIIARIAQDGIHLPKSFGKHRISYWYIDYVPDSTWWQNYRNVIVGCILVFVLGFVVLTLRWLWIHRHQYKFPYRPVGSAVPQLELQTM